MFLSKSVRIIFYVFLGLLCFYPGFAGEIETAGSNAALLINADEIDTQIDRINSTLAEIRAVASDQVLDEFGVTDADIERRLLDLGMLKSAYERLQDSLNALVKIEKDKLSIKDRYETYRAKGMGKKPPYSLTLLDATHEELSTTQRSQENIDLTIKLLAQEVVEKKDKLKAVERRLRQNQEKLAEAGAEAKKQMKWRVDEDTIQLRYLQISIQARQNEIRRYELEKGLTALHIALLKEQTSYIKSNVAYDDEDLKHQLAVIQQKKADIQKENKRLDSEQTLIEKKWLKAQQDFERRQPEDERAISEAYLKSRIEWQKTYQIALELNQQAALLMDRQILVVNQRYKLIKGGDSISFDELEKLREAVEKGMENLNQTLQIQQNYMVTLQKQVNSFENRLGEEGEPIRRHLSVHLDALRKQLERRLVYQSIILDTDQIEKRLFREIQDRMGQVTLSDHIIDIKKEIVDFWNIEIWVIDNQPLTLGKVVIALVILFLGMFAVRFVLALIHTRFLLKSQFKETTASAVHKIMSYSAYLLVCLFALRMVNIPLTAFAFLGGAVAIGFGFGAQNLINNFISGFIILGERPINIGDLIELDGVLGKVEEIGARCTRVRTGENIHILVPNSSFIERNITNWTLSDEKIRTNIVVGVSYGSPVLKVREQLLKATSQVKPVLTYPEPFVLFNDFGDNALIFHVYFWVKINRVIERRQIESDVRFKIDEFFSQEGLVIAFPQRDVHLDTLSPLKIRLESEPGEKQ